MSTATPISWSAYLSSHPDSGIRGGKRHLWTEVTYADAEGRPAGDFRTLCGIKVPREVFPGAPGRPAMRSRVVRDEPEVTAWRDPCVRCERAEERL